MRAKQNFVRQARQSAQNFSISQYIGTAAGFIYMTAITPGDAGAGTFFIEGGHSIEGNPGFQGLAPGPRLSVGVHRPVRTTNAMAALYKKMIIRSLNRSIQQFLDHVARHNLPL